MMESEWCEYVKHDESHLKKWGCIAMARFGLIWVYIPMLSIPMGGVDVILGVQWLQSLWKIAFNFQELFLNFFSEGKEVELRGIAGKPGKIISSNVMTKLLKKEQ